MKVKLNSMKSSESQDQDQADWIAIEQQQQEVKPPGRNYRSQAMQEIVHHNRMATQGKSKATRDRNAKLGKQKMKKQKIREAGSPGKVLERTPKGLALT
jgi:hypothetical protein